MLDIRNYADKIKGVALLKRREGNKKLNDQAEMNTSQVMIRNLSSAAPLCELEATEKATIFELGAPECLHDPDELLGRHVWEFFIRFKFKGSDSRPGLSPESFERNGLFSREFDDAGAIKQIIEADPHLKVLLHNAERPTLYKALGLSAQSTTLNLKKIIAILSQFCQYDANVPSQEQRVRDLVSQEPAMSQHNTDRAEPHRQSSPGLHASHFCDDHAYTIALKEMGDAECRSPKYTLIQLGFDPPRWRATVQYNGVESFAEGSNKKAAKHSASKALLLQLGRDPCI